MQLNIFSLQVKGRKRKIPVMVREMPQVLPRVAEQRPLNHISGGPGAGWLRDGGPQPAFGRGALPPSVAPTGAVPWRRPRSQAAEARTID